MRKRIRGERVRRDGPETEVKRKLPIQFVQEMSCIARHFRQLNFFQKISCLSLISKQNANLYKFYLLGE